MTGQTQHSPSPEVCDVILDRGRRRSSQLIWLIPIIAAIIGISLAVMSYLDRGPIITITFRSGEGIEVGKTKIKYKDVQIGQVKGITIAKDRSHVVVTAELNREAKELVVKDTRFWVVRARIAVGSVSGLGTLMGGSYIGVDAGNSQEKQYEFKGLEIPPVIAMDDPGSQFILHAIDIGSLDVASPIYYRRMQVGEVISYELDKDGKGVTLKTFIRSPYDRYIKANTFFWHASGIDFTLDANGIRVDTESMVTILLGGIAFQSPDNSNNSPPAAPNSIFALFPNKDEAMKRPDTVVETYVLVFRESVRGLQVGAPVDLRGVTVGEVSRISVELDTHRKSFSMPVEVLFYPERLRARYHNKSQHSKPQNSRELLSALVENGFRAQIRNGNLLTGQLYVALDFFPKAQPSKINWSNNPPEFPTIAGSMEQFQTILMQIVQKLEKVPLEELAGDARQTIRTLDDTLKSADKLIKNVDTVVPEARTMLVNAQASLDDVRKTLDEARKTLGSAEQTLSPDAPLQQDLREALREVGRTAQTLRVLGDYLERHPESLIRGKKGDGR